MVCYIKLDYTKGLSMKIYNLVSTVGYFGACLISIHGNILTVN